MTTIKKADFINSIAAGFQFISHYHSPDFIKALCQAYKRERSPAAKQAMAQLLLNSKMAAEGKRPMCQDTGLATVFLKIGMNVRWDTDMLIDDMVNEGISQAYLNNTNPLRASIVEYPLGKRKNTGNNTPGVIYTHIVPGDKLDVYLAAKGFGSENKSKLLMLNPHDNIVEAVLKAVERMGAGWCPPGILGIGIGGSSEKAMLLAKESLLAPVDIHKLINRGPKDEVEELRLELYEKINQLGIGAQGLGGLTTVLDVKVKDYPTHAAGLPVGIIPNCASTRHIHFQLDGSGEATFNAPSLDDWPKIVLEKGEEVIRVNLENITKEDVKNWEAGQTIYLSGKILTGRDAAHKRLVDMFAKGEQLPEGVDFHNRFIYYVGPVPKSKGEVIGSAGPTTAHRMDKYTELMLSQYGILGMIGKAERGQETIKSIREHGAVYLIAVGGAAYLVSQAIKSARIIAFEDLAMEAIHELEVEDMPLMVGIDARGNSVHHIGPLQWKGKG